LSRVGRYDQALTFRKSVYRYLTDESRAKMDLSELFTGLDAPLSVYQAGIM